jgi:hypothetical protein
MRLGIVRSAIITLALTLASVAPLFAQNQPDTSLIGAINGRELCEQRICGSAIFAAVFAGQIDGRPAVGLALGAIQHQLPLPQPGELCVPIFRGSWSISTLRRTLAGDVDDQGGTICPLDGTHFQVDLTMNITQGGKGSAHLTVFLDHSPLPLPPIITGFITQ